MFLLEKLCVFLGIEIEEEWLGDDGETYYIDPKGELIRVIYPHVYGSGISHEKDKIERVLSGELKPMWKPKKEEIYYMPDMIAPESYFSMMWMDVSDDLEAYREGLVFKTREEAADMTRKAIQFIREERLNGGD